MKIKKGRNVNQHMTETKLNVSYKMHQNMNSCIVLYTFMVCPKFNLSPRIKKVAGNYVVNMFIANMN